MDPATGRFTQEDTYQGNLYDQATLHKYSYANDNPVVYCDPSGYFGDFISAIASVAINCILNNSTAIAYGVGIGALVSGASAFALGKKDISTDSLLGAIIGGTFGALSSIKAVIHLGMLLSIESLSVESAIAIQSFADGQKKEGTVHASLALLAAYGYVSGLTAAFNTSSAYGSKIDDSNYESSNAVKDRGLLETSYGSYSPKNKTKLWGQEKYVTEKGLNTFKQHLSGEMEADYNNAMIARLENTYKNNTKISGTDLDFYAHEIYETRLMNNGISYEEAHEAAKAYYNAVEFNFYHPDVIKQYSREFSTPWFSFWGMEKK